LPVSQPYLESTPLVAAAEAPYLLARDTQDLCVVVVYPWVLWVTRLLHPFRIYIASRGGRGIAACTLKACETTSGPCSHTAAGSWCRVLPRLVQSVSSPRWTLTPRRIVFQNNLQRSFAIYAVILSSTVKYTKTSGLLLVMLYNTVVFDWKTHCCRNIRAGEMWICDLSFPYEPRS